MKYSSDYEHNPDHWRFARTLPRLPYRAPRRFAIGAWVPLVLVLILAVIGFRWP